MFLDVCIILAYMKDVIAKEIFLLLFRKSSCSLLFTPFYYSHYTWQSSQSLLLNENHKFSVEILKHAHDKNLLQGALPKNFSTATKRLVWGTSFHACFTRGRRFESDLGLFRLNSQEAMVRAHF